jgi:outer membrane protein
MNKLLIFLLFFSVTINVGATDIINLYDRALKHNIDLSQKKTDLDIANEVVKQTQSSMLPEINFSARASETTIERYDSGGTYDPSNYDRDTYNLSIKQPLFHLYVFDEIKKSKGVLKENEIREKDSQTIIILETVRHYFNLIRQKNLLELNQIKKEFNFSKYSASKKLYDSGNITIEEYEKHKNNYDASLIEVNISKDALSEIKNEVYIFSGKELNDINDIKLLEFNHHLYEIQDLIQSANINNNSIKLAKQNIQISRNDIASQKSKHYPTLDLIAEYDYIDITQGGSQFGATTREDSSISLVLNFPIYNGGYQSSKTKEARLKYKKAQLEYTNSKRSLRKDLIDTLNAYNTNKKRYDLSMQLTNSDLRVYKSATLGNEKGIYTDTQLLEARIKYQESLFNSKNIMMDYIYSEMTLDYLRNVLNYSDLRKINTYLVW